LKLNIDISELENFISTTLKNAVESFQPIEQTTWNYYSLKEAARLLQIKTTTLIDKRQPYLSEIEYAQAGKIFWFEKASLEKYIKNRTIRKYKSKNY
jgi:hypothetical protein